MTQRLVQLHLESLSDRHCLTTVLSNRERPLVAPDFLLTPDNAMGDLVWLASFPKSGNTWMRVFLHNLFVNDSRPVDLNRMQGGIFQSDSALTWFRFFDKRPLEDWSFDDVACMRPKVHELIAETNSGSVFCKTHNALMTMRGHSTINLNVTSGAIYIVRNPLDVTLSLADFLGVGVDKAIDFLVSDFMETDNDPVRNTVCVALGSWSQHVESWTGRPNPSLHVVRYEDMLEHPLTTFGKTAEFLGLKPSRQRLSRAIRNSSFKVLRKQENRTNFKEKSIHQERFFRRGTAGGWKQELSYEQVQRICEAHREQMKRFDYLPEGS